MNAQSYLSHSGLNADLAAIEQWRVQLKAAAEQAALPAELDTLYRYRVPELGEGGACSLPDLLAEQPYDLALTLGGINEARSLQLARLHAMVGMLAHQLGCGWLGVYQSRKLTDGSLALVKLAYIGKPSRAEFPLTAEFASHSNNSAVGLSGQGRVIQDVAAYLAQGGAYYSCDGAVQSEACLPVLDAQGKVLGIIDAEDSRRDFFQPAALAALVALCLAVPAYLP